MVRNANFVESCLSSCVVGKKAQHGFDLTLQSVGALVSAGCVYKDKTVVCDYSPIQSNTSDLYVLGSGVYSLTFNEGGRVPEKHCGWIKTRSSLVRNGSLIDSGLYDTGFYVDFFGAMLFVNHPIIIEQDARVAQLLFLEAEEAATYGGQWQGNKDKK